MTPRPIPFADVREDDTIEITGVCTSITPRRRFEKLRGVVGSGARLNSDGKRYLKLWPDETIDDGKLWFCEDGVTQVVLLDREE